MSDIIKLMEPMIKEAEEKGLWLESTYQNIPFSPKELRAKQAQGDIGMSQKGSYHRRKLGNKNEMIFVPKMIDADNLLIDKETFINCVQVAYEVGYKQHANGMHLKFGEKMLEKITSENPELFKGDV